MKLSDAPSAAPPDPSGQAATSTKLSDVATDDNQLPPAWRAEYDRRAAAQIAPGDWYDRLAARVFGVTPGAPAPAPPSDADRHTLEMPGGTLAAQTKGFLHGLGDLFYGGAEVGAAAPEIGGAAYDTGQTAQLQKDVVQATKQREADWKNDPTRQAHPFQAGAGRFAGDITGVIGETGPLVAFAPEGAGGAALLGGGTGYLGALTEPVYDADHFGAAKARQVAWGTGTGTVLGPLFHGIASGLRWYKGYRAATPEEKASDIVGEAVAEKTRGGGPTATEVMDQMADAKANGQPYAMLDVVPELGGTVYRGAGGGRTMIKNFQEGRTKEFANETDLDDALQRTQQGKRLVDRIAQSFGDASARLTAKALALQRSVNSRAPWEKAMSRGPVWSPRLQQALDFPEVKRGLAEGWKIERQKAFDEGRALNPLDYAIVDFDAAGDPVFGKVPNMRMLQLAKEGLDAQWDAMAKRDPWGRIIYDKPLNAFTGFRKAFVNVLDDLNPDYKEARRQWAGDTESMEAVNNGRHLLDKGVSSEEFAERWNDMTPGNREFFKLGLADKLKSDLDNWRAAGDASKALIRTPAVRQKLRLLFSSKEEFNSFTDFIGREGEIFETGHKVMGGSQTGERVAQDRRFADKVALARSALHTIAHPSPYSIYDLSQAWGRVRNRASEPALNEALGRLLTNPDVPLSRGYGPTDLFVGPAGRPAPPPVTGAPSWLGGIAPYIMGGY